MQATPETIRIEELVTLTRKRLLRSRVTVGLLLTLGAALAWLLVAAGLDMLMPMSVPFRVAAAAIFWLLFLTSLTVFILRPVVRPPRMADVAFRIEATIPGMHNRLVTVLDLKQRNGTADTDPAFFDRLVQQTQQRLTHFRVEKVVSPRPVRRGAAALTGVVAALVALCLAFHEQMPTAIERILLPTAAIAPGSWVKLAADPGDLDVLQGEPATLRARFLRGHADDLTIHLRSEDAAWYTYPMHDDDRGRPSFAITAVNKSYEYQIAGGGTWTDVHRVTMLTRPIIEKLATTVRLPEYMMIPEPRPVDENATQVNAPVGSTVELTATVSGQPQRGVVHLYKATNATADETHEEEIVWFDDELPPDVDEIGTWKWTAEQVYSGARAHTFGWARKPYGFTTRLSKLTIQPDASFFVYVWLDPADPPQRLLIGLTVDAQELTLAWGAAKPEPVPTMKGPVVEQGPLPATGKWVRLEVPINKALPGRAAPAAVSAITFAIDKGRIYFDRPGSLRRKQEKVQKTTLEAMGTLPMTLDEKTAKWVGHLPVQTEGSYALEFFNTRGAASPAMKPMPLLAVVDQPPSVVVERPGKSVTIDKAEPVPMMVRAFDDYGVADVAIQIGATADKFNDPRIIAKYDQPQLNPMVISSIDPRMMAMAPGASAYYRLVVHDTKGQVAYSEPYRLGLAKPGAVAADADKGPSPLKPILDSIARLLDIHGHVARLASELASALPPGLASTTQPATLELKNPDGTPMTPDQIAALFKKRFAELPPAEQKEVTELDRKLTEERLAQYALSQQLSAAAVQADQSAMSLPLESAAMQQMAQRLQQMSAEQGEQTAMDKAVMDRLSKLNELEPAQQQELAHLRAQLQEIEAARQKMENNPQDAQGDMQAMLAQMQAAQAARAVGSLDSAIQSQRAELAQLRDRIADLQARTGEAPGKELNAISGDQAKLDADAIKKMREAQDLLREQEAGRDAKQDEAMVQPWDPPGPLTQVPPSEQDTPEKPDPNKKKDSKAAAADAAAEAERKQEEANAWWDKPADGPPLGSTTEDDPRFANRDQRPVPPLSPDDSNAPDEKNDNGAAPDRSHSRSASRTPRQQLEDHQGAVVHHLANEEADLATAQKQLAQMSAEITKLAEQLAAQGNQAGQPPGQDASQADGQSPPQSNDQNQGPNQPNTPAAAMAQLQQMMASPSMRWAMAAGPRSAMAAAGKGGQRPTTPGGISFGNQGGAPPGSGPVVHIDLSGIDVGSQGAMLYRLPPRVREPLIQGMQERGPEAYQALIDAYYRQLSKDVK